MWTGPRVFFRRNARWQIGLDWTGPLRDFRDANSPKSAEPGERGGNSNFLLAARQSTMIPCAL
ncbi:hypothetical protein DSM3645_00155 [Blastopirellula marina DSM 3645]|uniref:Uncharacterized protein n=1 Tax=Blastopirellula marina DSM 3645 TaxID=314230 RepID=A3ZMB0_9BACT|nr:hypothetical protein DSM3645_00155 [Blastopirellula marina DSM 3645]